MTLDNAHEAFAHALAAHRDGIARIIEQQRELPTWDDLVLAIDELDAQLNAVLLAASPLTYKGEDWANLINECYGQLLTRFDEKLASSVLRDLYHKLAERMGMNLDAHERATLQWYSEAFIRHGAQLDEAGKQTLAQINGKSWKSPTVLPRTCNWKAPLSARKLCWWGSQPDCAMSWRNRPGKMASRAG